MRTAILNVYKRGYTLEEQVKACEQQTIKPQEIIIYNNGLFCEIPEWIKDKHTVIESNKNFGVWARFSLALNATTKYICVFDDDTIPGCEWIANCIEHNEKKQGLYGTVGCIFNTTERYAYATRRGRPKAHNDVKEVDLIGHARFFEKELLTYYYRELEDTIQYMKCGEDMHFSYVLQKYGNIGSYVPPHPTSNTQKRGGQYHKSVRYGTDPNATYLTEGINEKFTQFYTHIIAKGFKPLMIRDKELYHKMIG